MFGKKGLHRQRRHFDLLQLHLHSGCLRIIEAADQSVHLEAGEHCQIGSFVLMVRDEQSGSAVSVRDGRVLKSELLLLRIVFEKLLKHLRLRLDQYSMPVIFGHEVPERSSVNPLLAPIWTKKKSDRSADYFGEQEIQHVNRCFYGVPESFDAITEHFDAVLDERFQLSSEGHVALPCHSWPQRQRNSD
jgi:hypothetical protein